MPGFKSCAATNYGLSHLTSLRLRLSVRHFTQSPLLGTYMVPTKLSPEPPLSAVQPGDVHGPRTLLPEGVREDSIRASSRGRRAVGLEGHGGSSNLRRLPRQAGVCPARMATLEGASCAPPPESLPGGVLTGCWVGRADPTASSGPSRAAGGL